MEETLTIGQVAERAGVNRQTLRYYERRGIVKPVARSGGGYRLYAHDATRIVRFIKRAQELGFTLDEVEQLLSFRESSKRTCSQVRAKAQQKLTDIDDKIARLESIRDTLTQLVAECAPSGRAPECAILDALDDPDTLAGD